MGSSQINEQAFQKWYAEHSKKLGLNPNPDDPAHHYDYRAAYQAGVVPDASGHWPSKFKTPDHPNRYVGGVDTITGMPQPPPGFQVDEMPTPPAGFTLDVPKPPQGFVVDNIPDVESTPQPVSVPEAAYQGVKDVGRGVYGVAEAATGLFTGMADLIATGYGALGAYAETGDWDAAAKHVQEQSGTWKYDPRTEEGKLLEAIAMKPIEWVHAFWTKLGEASMLPAEEVYGKEGAEILEATIPEATAQLSPAQAAMFSAAGELATLSAAGPVGKGLFGRKAPVETVRINPKTGIPEVAGDWAKAQKMIERQDVARTPRPKLAEMEHLAKQPQLEGTIGEKLIAAEQRGTRRFELKEGKLETAKKSPWSPEFAQEVKGKYEPGREVTGLLEAPVKKKHPSQIFKRVDLGDRGVGYVKRDVTGGRHEPVVNAALKRAIFEGDEFAGVPPQGAPHPGAAPGMPERVGPQPTGSAFTRGRTTVEQPTTVEPAVAEQAVGQLAELHKKYVQLTKPPVGVDTSADIGKMGRFKYGERVPGQPTRPTGEGVVPPTEGAGVGITEGIEPVERPTPVVEVVERPKTESTLTKEIKVLSDAALEQQFLKLMEEGKDKTDTLYKVVHDELHRRAKEGIEKAKREAEVVPVEKATPKEVAVEAKETPAARPSEAEAVTRKGAKVKKPAAGEITDATKINKLTMGGILDKIRQGKAKTVIKELKSILKEHGDDYYQDVMKPAKIAARIWQDLREEGVPSKEAKAQATKILQDVDYEGHFNRVRKGEELVAKPEPKEFTRTAKATEQRTLEAEDIAASLADKQSGYLKEGKRTELLREHDFFSEMPEGEIPRWVTMAIEHMTPKELRRFLEAMDKKGEFDWSKVSPQEMAEYAAMKYGVGRYLKMDPETFIEIRGRDKIKYEELERSADIASTYRSDMTGTTLNFLGVQSMYESVARMIRNARIKKEKYSASKAYEARKRIEKTAKDMWGKGADKEINRFKKQLFGENIPTDKLAMNDLKKLELGIGELRRQVGETKGGSSTKVARKGKTKETTVYQDQANAIKGAEELTDTFMRKLSSTDKGWGISLIETHGLRIFREMGEPIKKLFYDRITDGDKLATQRFKAHVAEMDEVIKGIGRAEEREVTKYAISKQKGGIEALKEQGETIPTWEDLSPKGQAAYEWMRKGYEQFYKDVNAARVKAGLEPFPKQPDYFTFWNRLHNSFDKGLSFEEISFKHISKETPFPYRKRRIGKQELWLNGFDIYKTYAERAFRHEELTPIVAHCRELLFKMDDGYKLSEFKPNTHAYLSEWLNTASGAPVISKYPQVAKIGRMLNENIAAAVLAYNIRSAMIQWTAIINTYSRLGEIAVAKGAGVFFDDAISQFVEKHSNVINREFDVHARDIMSHAREGQKKIARVGMKPLQWMDKQTAKWTWYSAHEYAVKRGMKAGSKEAIRFADDVVTETQASAKEYELSPIQRSVAGKTLTLFQTFVINQFNYLIKDVLGYKNPRVSKVEAAQRTMRWILGATVINTIFEDLLGINSPFPAPFNRFVEERKKGKQPIAAAARASSEMLDLIPLLSSLRYGSSPGGPVVELFQEVGELISDKPGPKTAIPEIAGKALGVPGTAQATKTWKRLSWGSSLPAALLGAGKRKPTKKTGGRTRRRAR